MMMNMMSFTFNMMSFIFNMRPLILIATQYFLIVHDSIMLDDYLLNNYGISFIPKIILKT